MNLHGHILSQSPQFTLGLTLGGVEPTGLDKGIMTCNHHDGVTQSRFPALKILPEPPVHLPGPQAQATTDPITTICLVLLPKIVTASNPIVGSHR